MSNGLARYGHFLQGPSRILNPVSVSFLRFTTQSRAVPSRVCVRVTCVELGRDHLMMSEQQTDGRVFFREGGPMRVSCVPWPAPLCLVCGDDDDAESSSPMQFTAATRSLLHHTPAALAAR